MEIGPKGVKQNAAAHRAPSPFGPDARAGQKAGLGEGGGVPTNSGGNAPETLYEKLQKLAQQHWAQNKSERTCLERDRERLLLALDFWTHGEPLQRLLVCCNQALWERAVLMDHEYLCERTAAILAREWVMEGTANRTEKHLAACAFEALDDILADEELWAKESGPISKTRLRPYEFMVYQFGLQWEQAMPSAARFNQLGLWTRRAFYALLLNRCSIEKCLELGLGPVERLRKEVRRGLHALLLDPCTETIVPQPERSRSITPNVSEKKWASDAQGE